MLDPKFIRENKHLVESALKHKNVKLDLKRLLELDAHLRTTEQELELLRAERNSLASSMGKSKPTDDQIKAGKKLKDAISELEASITPIAIEYRELMLKVPNIPLDSVPIGKSEDDNVIVKYYGKMPKFDFPVKSHGDLAIAKGWLDKERAAKVAGARFAYIKGDLAKMQLALMQFAFSRLSDQAWIDKVIKKHKLKVSNNIFTPVIPPMMIRTEVFEAMGRLEPRDDRYQVGLESDQLWLQGSAEHTIGSMYYQEVLPEKEFPIRYLGYATSFRREAGTYGKDSDGIFRMHQFDKLEMESFSLPEAGEAEHNFLIAIQIELYSELGLHFYSMNKCSADIGDPNASGWDMCAYFPGQSAYREISSADYMTDFQSRRLQSRVKRSNGSIDLVHTNDATCIVLSRIPAAILEQNQTKSGDIKIPKVLQGFFNNQKVI